MILYTFIYFFVCISGYVAETIGSRKAALIFFVTTLSLVVGLRAVDVGIDTASYLHIFHTAVAFPEHGYIESLEPIYIAFNQWIHVAGGGFPVVQFLVAAISFILIGVTVYRLSVPVTLAVAVFLAMGPFFFFHSGMRQGVALAIVFFSSVFVVERKFFIFTLAVLVAAGFHLSSLVFLPMYFLVRVKIWVIFWISVWLGSLALVMAPGLVVLFLELLALITPASYSGYFEDHSRLISVSQGLGLKTLLMQVFFIVYLYSYSIAQDREKIMLFLAMGAVILFNVFYHVAHLDRIVSYFSVFHMVAIPLVIRMLFDRFENFLMTAGFLLAFFVLYFRQLVTDPYSVLPYESLIPGLDIAWGL